MIFNCGLRSAECGINDFGQQVKNMFGLAFSHSAAKAGGVDVSAPVSEARYVVMDTELTGLDTRRDSIVSIGAVAMTGGRILLGDRFYEMVSPETALTSESVVIHHITPSDVAGKPSIGGVLEDFLAYCEGAVVVGHFLSLDLAFLNREMKRLMGRSFGRPVADTLQIHEWIRNHHGDFSRHYQGMAPNVDLFTIAQKYHIQITGAHNALMDAFITAQLFQRFLSFLPGLGVRTVKELLKIGRP